MTPVYLTNTGTFKGFVKREVLVKILAERIGFFWFPREIRKKSCCPITLFNGKTWSPIILKPGHLAIVN